MPGSSKMPGRAPPQNPEDRTNRDIREFISPLPSLQRRRRIIESSSSDEQNLDIQAGHQADAQFHLPLSDAANNENEHPEPIQIDSDSESSDSMYVASVLQPAVAMQERNMRAAPQRQQQPIPPRQRRSTPQQQLPGRRQRRETTQRQLRYCAEAESTSEEESTGLSADESDQNAADLYRAAILGVRNRPIAAQQVITESTDAISASCINS